MISTRESVRESRKSPQWEDADEAPRSPAELPARATIIARLLICIALYSIPAATILRPLDEFDTWWHLRTGQWIVEHGTVPTTDPFSGALEGKPWVAYSWLFEVLLYELYQCFGLGGIVLYRVLMTLLLVAVIHRFVAKREPRFIVAAGLTAAALAACAPLLCERPWLFSIIFCTLTLDAVLDLRQGKAGPTTWLLPLAYVLWANVHIQFVFGLLILGLACAGPVIDRLLGRAQPDDHANTAGSPEWWKLEGLTVACLLATLINPYHGRLWLDVLALGGQSSFYHLVGEMRSLGFRSPWDWAVLGLTGAAVFTLGRRPRLGAFEVLLLIAAAYFSFQCRRDLWFVVLASLAVLAATPRPKPSLAEQFVLNSQRAVVVGLGVAFVVAVILGWHGRTEERLVQEVSFEFPVHAASVVEERGYPGPLYNQADWGSYLMWRLPHLPIAIDGRLHLYGDERAFRFQRTGDGRPGWETDPDLARAGVVILRPQVPLTALLRRDDRFQLVHEDPIAVVFVARPPASAARETSHANSSH